MSGSSLDGLDIAFCRLEMAWDANVFGIINWGLLEAGTLAFATDWQQRLRSLPNASAFDFCNDHAAFGHYLGELVNRFCEEKNIDKTAIDLIASHGHTIFHEPSHGFTVQIGDGAALAAKTGCAVVSDFRTADIALGGQGAPLAPMADRILFPGYDFYLNLGGIANITCSLPSGRFVAFDICGANQALNALANLLGQSYDNNGEIAASGQLDPVLWRKINREDFFQQPYPKSLSNQWVQEHLIQICLAATSPIPDRLHTVCQHVGFQIKQSVAQIIDLEAVAKQGFRLLATGGGVFNGFLMECIQKQLPNVEVVVPSENVVKFKEALLMALLGVMRMEGVPNCMSSVTGARKDAIGGGIHVG